MRGQSGFTLLELAVATLILSVGILGMASVMASTRQREVLNESRLEMTALADSRLEELRAYAAARSVDTMKLTVGGSLTTSVANHADTLLSPAERWFIRRWQVANGKAGTREVTLRIQPLDRAKLELGQLDFTTLILVQ